LHAGYDIPPLWGGFPQWERFHLDSGTIDGVDAGLDLDVVVFDVDLHQDCSVEKWVADGPAKIDHV